ncbi:signal peptide peptidase-like 2C, partial [Carlito syrichta]|uniref:Signal peptide peptidase-like 2C n=1 Tax=Carlito syrichta TaxID=1868482 RepID=A0A1U7UT01_CARSF
MGSLALFLPAGFLLLLLAGTEAWGHHGVVHVVSGNWSRDYCVLLGPDDVTLPRDLRHAPLLPLHDGTSASWCPGKGSSHQAGPGAPSQRPLRRTMAMATQSSCSLRAQGQLAQGWGAHGLLIVGHASDQPCSDASPATQHPRGSPSGLHIPVAMLRHADLQDILRHTRGLIRVAMYAPPEPTMDYNLLVLFILAVGTVAAGGYWAGLSEARQLQRPRARGGGGAPGGLQQPEAEAQEGEGEDEDTPVDFMLAMVSAVITLSCVTALLYFSNDCFVYATVGLFGLGAGVAGVGLYSCLAPLVRRPPPWPRPRPLHRRSSLMQWPPWLLAGLCTLVALLWVACCHEESWAGLRQDGLGLACFLL